MGTDAGIIIMYPTTSCTGTVAEGGPGIAFYVATINKKTTHESKTHPMFSDESGNTNGVKAVETTKKEHVVVGPKKEDPDLGVATTIGELLKKENVK